MSNHLSRMNKPFVKCIILLLSSILPLTLRAQPFPAKVIGVSDGDTITVLHSGSGRKLRLHGIDAPEKGQDFGEKAKLFVSEKAFGKTVSVEAFQKDKYGRDLGRSIHLHKV